MWVMLREGKAAHLLLPSSSSMSIPTRTYIPIGLGILSVLGGYVATWIVLDERPSTNSRTLSTIESAAFSEKKLREFNDSLPDILQLDDRRSQRQKLDALIAGLGRMQLQEALSTALKLEGEDRKQVVTALLFRWVELDPKSAIDKAKALTDDIVRPSLWKELLTHWAEQDLTSAQAWATAQPAGQRQREAVVRVAEVLAERDPAAAVRLIERFDLKNTEMTILEKAFGAWAVRDFAAASGHALAMKNTRIQQAMFRGLLQSKENRPLRETLDWVATLPDVGFRNETTQRLVKRWMTTDPLNALEYVVGMKLSKWRRDILAEGIGQLAKDAPEKARDVYRRLESAADQELVINALIHGSMQTDRDRTLEFVRNLPEGKVRLKAASEVVAVLATVSIPEAKQMLDLLPYGPERKHAISSIAKALSETDLPASIEFCLAQKTATGAVNQTIYELLRTWVKRDNATAVEWLRNLPNGSLKTDLSRMALQSSETNSGQKGLELASTFDSESYAQAARGLAGNWALQDFKAASEWVLKMPPGPAREKAVGGIAGGLAINKKFPEAVSWMNQLRGSDYDEAAETLSLDLAFQKKDHAQGLEYAAKISDPRQKFGIAHAIASEWQKSDSNAATSWIKATTLFDHKTKQRLLGAPPQ